MLDQLYMVLGGLGALLGVLWMAFAKGKQAQRRKDAEISMEAVEKANEVRRKVDAEPDPVERLRNSRWMRK